MGPDSQWWGGQLGAWPPSALAVSTLRPRAVPVNRMDGRGLGRPPVSPQAGAVHEDSSRPHLTGPAPPSSQPSSWPPDPQQWSTGLREGRGRRDNQAQPGLYTRTSARLKFECGSHEVCEPTEFHCKRACGTYSERVQDTPLPKSS